MNAKELTARVEASMATPADVQECIALNLARIADALEAAARPSSAAGFLPKSPAGLPAGARWNNHGVICTVERSGA